MTEYRDFKYWLVETMPDGRRVYRIQFPGGHKTPALIRNGEMEIKTEIDRLIMEAGDGS